MYCNQFLNIIVFQTKKGLVSLKNDIYQPQNFELHITLFFPKHWKHNLKLPEILR